MSEAKKAGLFYRRADGVDVPQGNEGEQWLITLRIGGGVRLQRFIAGSVDENYREMNGGEGVLAVIAAILGFEPPRAPVRRDKRAD